MERNRRTQPLARAAPWHAASATANGRRALALRNGMPARAAEEPDLEQLARTIDVEIIPRLVLSRRPVPCRAVEISRPERHVGAHEIAEFCEIVLRADDAKATSYLDHLHAAGISFEALLMELLAPAARRLGDLWQADHCSFTEVALATCRLQAALHSVGAAFRHEALERDIGRRALLIPMPGDWHSLGVAIVAEYFRRAGWEVWSGPLATIDDLIRLVRRERFDLIGLSVGCEARLEALSASIHAVRRTSRNRHIGVMVGGPALNDHPELVSLVGADVTATGGAEAVMQAHGLLSILGNDE